MNAPELVKEYLTSQPTRTQSIQDKRHTKLYDKGMPSHPIHRLSSAEYFYSYYPPNAIKATMQQAEDPKQIRDVAACLAYSDESLTTYHSAREGNTHPCNKIPAAAHNMLSQHFRAHLYAVEADLPRDVSLEGTGELSLAPLSSAEELLGTMSSGKQRSPPQYSSHTPCTLDMGDFMDHAMGDCGPDQL